MLRVLSESSRLSSWDIRLVGLSDIHPTEEISQRAAEALRYQIEVSGFWTRPVLLDRVAAL